MFKMERLIFAMATHEGWTPKGFDGNVDGSRSYRNHNPGNLRSSPFQCGTDGGFSVFRSDLVGYMAMEYDITMKAMGKTTTGLNGDSTIKDLINVWAPTTDGNNTQKYLDDVCALSGLAPTTKLKELLK